MVKNKKLRVLSLIVLLFAVGIGAAYGWSFMSPYKEETQSLTLLCAERLPTRPVYCDCLVTETRKAAGEDFPLLAEKLMETGEFRYSKELKEFLGEEKKGVARALTRASGQCIPVWRSGQ